ncbi:MAG TPA: protein translocase subunit SecD, partial [Terriglobia bacterium]|nr:protein translocase subunit SecD [Terriglobia bacterium]
GLTILQWRLVVIVAVALLSVYLFAGAPPSVANMAQRIRLGLDLRGGTQLVLQVQTDDAIRLITDDTAESVKAEMVKQAIVYRQVNRTEVDEFTVVGVDETKDAEFRTLIADNQPQWDIASTGGEIPNTYTLKLKPREAAAARDQAVDQAINTIRNRVDEKGVAEAVVQRQGAAAAGEYEILVQFPGVDDPNQVKSLISTTALLELKAVVKGYSTREDALKDYGGGPIPSNLELLPTKPSAHASDFPFYVVERAAGVTGRDLKTAYSSRDQNNRPAVGFTLTPEGAKKFGVFTEKNIGRGLAIVLDGRVQSAPTIRSKITDNGEITGSYSIQDVNQMVLLLKSGALPASIKYLQESVLGPSLGADSIRHGVTAAVAALIGVVVFMLLYYRGSGINASVAMVLNLTLLLGAMAYMGSTMTLPGIAGVILTIGVGIDSNVLVFERIREELRAGKTAASAVATGFNRVFITLVDTHLAALISAGILYATSSSGPVRGFAVTLVIGLVSNMFTAVFVSRTLFEMVLNRKSSAEAISI